MRRAFLSVMIGLCLGINPLAQATEPNSGTGVEVEVNGQVLHAGKHRLPAGARLFDATQRAQVKQDAYLLGAAWYSQDARQAQLKQKLGVLFDLQQLILEARSARLDERTQLLERIKRQVELMPVTGRRLVPLDPVVLELERQHNRPVATGDQVHYPARPNQVAVIGAVKSECALPFEGLRDASSYLQDCPRHPEADSDWLWVIQPDGHFRRIGVAAWNAEAPQPLAPGAWLFVAIRRLADAHTDTLNAELPRFIATQPLPGITHTP